MIQIIGLRKSATGKNSDAFYEKAWRAGSLEDVLANPQAVLAQVPEAERWNLYFTVAQCQEEKRKLKEQWHIPIDIDGIDIAGAEPTEEELNAVISPVLDELGLSRYEVGITFSGGGIWLFIGIDKPITDEDYFKKEREYYGLLCKRINMALKRAGVKGEADSSVWSTARLARMPDTINQKPGRPDRRAFVIQGNIVRKSTDVRALSGAIKVESNEQVNPKFLQENYPAPDTKGILDPEKGCPFLVWARAHQNEVTEPQWYKVLSVVGRLPDGRKWAHEFSREYKKYSPDETDFKLDHALMYGPATCLSISQVSDKCKTCPHAKKENPPSSPIVIRSDEYIATKHTGFHEYRRNKEGHLIRGKPAIDDLVKFFYQEKGTVVSEEGSGAVWKWTGTHYEEMSNDAVANFAYENFDPKENESVNTEFFNRVRRSGMRPKRFFSDTVLGKVNFKNGVLDIGTREVFTHTESFGFRSVLSADYDAHALCPTWEEFLSSVTLGDEKLIKILQEFTGYIIGTSDCRYQKGLALMGTGSNGKSVFVNILKKLVSREGFSSLSLEDMNNPQNRLLMEGKMVNFAEENSYRDAFKNTSVMKNMVTGGEISVKRLYAQPYQYENTTKLVMLFNKLPRTGDDSEGFFRRFVMVPFDATFSDELGNRDVFIENKLEKELPGILNWAIEGLDRLVHQGFFTQSERSDKLLKEYKEEAMPITEFIEDNISYGGSLELVRDDAYAEYVQWTRDAGINYVMTRAQMFKVLREEFKIKKGYYPEEAKRSINGKLQRVFVGMGLGIEQEF